MFLLAIYTINRGCGIQRRTAIWGGGTSVKSLIHHTTTSNTHSLTLQQSQINRTHNLNLLETKSLALSFNSSFALRTSSRHFSRSYFTPWKVRCKISSASVGIKRDVRSHFVRVLQVCSHFCPSLTRSMIAGWAVFDVGSSQASSEHREVETVDELPSTILLFSLQN